MRYSCALDYPDDKFRRLTGVRKRTFEKSVEVATDTGYLAIRKLHGNSRHSRKRSKKHPPMREDKRFNREVSRERILNEHVIGALKRFRILSERYRNRRKRFALRFNLIAGIYNDDLQG